MNTGIVMIGFALVLLSVGMMVTPSAAAGPDAASNPGCCTAVSSGDTGRALNETDAGGLPFISIIPGTSTMSVPSGL